MLYCVRARDVLYLSGWKLLQWLVVIVGNGQRGSYFFAFTILASPKGRRHNRRPLYRLVPFTNGARRLSISIFSDHLPRFLLSFPFCFLCLDLHLEAVLRGRGRDRPMLLLLQRPLLLLSLCRQAGGLGVAVVIGDVLQTQHRAAENRSVKRAFSG